MVGVRRASDTRASNFIGTGQETSEYAVTDDPKTTDPTLRGSRRDEAENWWNNLCFVLDWLIAYPTKSVSYGQRVVSRQSFGGLDNHEHDTGGGQYGC